MKLDKLRQVLHRHKLDGLLVTRPENMRYLSGYTGEGALLVTQNKALLATDFRYWGQAGQQAPDYELFKVINRQESFYPALVSAAGKPRRLGFESSHVTVAEHQKLLVADSVEWLPAQDLVEALRLVKTRSELALIRRAAGISDAALEHIRGWIKPGMVERQVAWELEAFMRTHGAHAVAFDIIVGAGPGGAEAHHEPDDHIIQPGEPIVIDLGACVQGYRSDITRTYCIGRPGRRFKKIYDIVLRAQQAALDGIRAGMTCEQADSLARIVIANEGYGKRFGHSLGHGIGLAVHELPFARQKSDAPLPANATLTVEPGIYIPGWGGVRIEDLVLICKNGVELVSHASKDPLI